MMDAIKRQMERWQQVRGLGSAVAAVTRAVGIKPCGGCKKRAQVLDERFPLNKSDTLETEQEPNHGPHPRP